jgi:hypothetical protein
LRATDAAERLTQLERQAAAGGKVDAAERTRAEAALTKARIAAGEPWAERRAGVQAALRDRNRELRAFAAAHEPELNDELDGPATEAAAAVNSVGRAFLTAYEQRMAVEQQRFRLRSLASARAPDPNAVLRSRADDVVPALNAMFIAGGETPPLLREPLTSDPEPAPEPTAA